MINVAEFVASLSPELQAAFRGEAPSVTVESQSNWASSPYTDENGNWASFHFIPEYIIEEGKITRQIVQFYPDDLCEDGSPRKEVVFTSPLDETPEGIAGTREVIEKYSVGAQAPNWAVYYGWVASHYSDPLNTLSIHGPLHLEFRVAPEGKRLKVTRLNLVGHDENILEALPSAILHYLHFVNPPYRPTLAMYGEEISLEQYVALNPLIKAVEVYPDRVIARTVTPELTTWRVDEFSPIDIHNLKRWHALQWLIQYRKAIQDCSN